ncbi:uncharacterized protein LOC119546597 isoform X2 [Drosophila subpulchrella]|uniref:uncharacterized protein LOC119546597 isoform X2 n=1 Tax=Drosophila subpulchrella TaxID=1486046 RepID=UPI0018A14E7C|nr:uncharacterized protein LOC119546597 isoform X2 [Drosophila subpulchrella]
MERSNISAGENKKNRSTLKKIKSIDKIHKTYLPKTSDSKLKKLHSSKIKIKNTENSKIKNNNLDPNNTDSNTTERSFLNFGPKSRDRFFGLYPHGKPPSSDHYTASTKTYENMPEATGTRQSADLENHRARISSGEMSKPSVNSSSSECSANGGAPISLNQMNCVTFAEPEIGNISFSDPESSSSTNVRGREFLIPSGTCKCHDLGLNCFCFCQSDMQTEPGSIDSTTPSNFSSVEQLEVTVEDPCFSDSNEEIAGGDKDSDEKIAGGDKDSDKKIAGGDEDSDEKIAVGDEDSDDIEQNQDSEDRGFQMPDPEIRNSITQFVTTTTVTRSVSSFSMGLRSPSIPSSRTYCGPPPPEERNCLDIDGILRARHRRPPPRPNSVNDMLQSQSVYMSDYRPIMPMGRQINQFPEPRYGRRPFDGGRRFRDMPMRGGFEPRYRVPIEPFIIDPYLPDMPNGGGFEGRYRVPTEPIFIGPHPQDMLPEDGIEINYAFAPEPFSSNPYVGRYPSPEPNPFPYSPGYSTGTYGTGANYMEPQGRYRPRSGPGYGRPSPYGPPMWGP